VLDRKERHDDWVYESIDLGGIGGLGLGAHRARGRDRLTAVNVVAGPR
jgi:hypothetical protein